MASVEERLARIETYVEINNKLTGDLVKSIKGNGQEGLLSKYARIESCTKWLTWGFRGMYVLIMGYFVKQVF